MRGHARSAPAAGARARRSRRDRRTRHRLQPGQRVLSVAAPGHVAGVHAARHVAGRGAGGLHAQPGLDPGAPRPGGPPGARIRWRRGAPGRRRLAARRLPPGRTGRRRRVQGRPQAVIERVRGLGFADALAVAGAALVAAGLVVTGDGLVAAAQRTPGSSAMSWHDRLLLGLWNFRLEHALWFTIGLVMLWFALAIGATLLGRRDQTARLVGGVAVGFVLLAAAVAVGSTIVALSGSVGSGALQVTFTRNERIFTWLLQVATAASLSAAWL